MRYILFDHMVDVDGAALFIYNNNEVDIYLLPKRAGV